MARDRSQGRRAQKEAAQREKVADLRRQARAWYIRAFLAVIAAVLVGLLSFLLAGLVAAVVGYCIVEGTKLALEATRVQSGERR